MHVPFSIIDILGNIFLALSVDLYLGRRVVEVASCWEMLVAKCSFAFEATKGTSDLTDACFWRRIL